MKKSRLLLAALTAGAMIAGCGSKETAFTPETSCIYISEEGELSGALVEPFEGDVDTEDLTKYLESAVIRFNQESGAEGTARNKQGADRLPAALNSVTKDENAVRVVFDYASAEDLIRFRQTEDNEDDSNTVTALEVKPVSDATDWLIAADYEKADGGAAALDEMKKETRGKVVRIEGGGTFRFAGEVLYLALDAEKMNEYTVTVPDGGNAYVVFR